MKHFAILLLLVAFLAGCDEDGSDKYIRTDTTYRTIVLGTENYLDVSYNTDNGFTHIIGDRDIVELKGTDKLDDGRIRFILKGLKPGDTEIRFMEGVTNNYETAVTIHCANLSGVWTEWREGVSLEEAVQTHVVAADENIKDEIEQEIREEAMMRLHTDYYFHDDNMTFSMTTPDGAEHSGTYEQENNTITLHYGDTTEQFRLHNGSHGYYIDFDYTDKYKERYPDAEVLAVFCDRCFSMPRRQ